MATFDITFRELTEDQFNSLMEWWRGGFGKAEGFRFKFDSNAPIFRSQGYTSPKTRRGLAEEIAGAIKNEAN